MTVNCPSSNLADFVELISLLELTTTISAEAPPLQGGCLQNSNFLHQFYLFNKKEEFLNVLSVNKKKKNNLPHKHPM